LVHNEVFVSKRCRGHNPGSVTKIQHQTSAKSREKKIKMVIIFIYLFQKNRIFSCEFGIKKNEKFYRTPN
jgi:hypothetical protein